MATDEPAGPGATDESIADELRDLYASARIRVETELAFQKARASLAGKWAGIAAALGCAAAALLFLALMAAVFGLVLALANVLGPLAATGVVTGTFALLALVAGLLAWRRARRIVGLMRERNP